MPNGFPLATVFAASREGAEVGEALERSLSRLVERARAAWPALAVEDAAYVRYLAERASPGSRLDEIFAEDLYLACACAAGDAIAVAAFDRRYLGELAITLSRSGVEPAAASEVVQLLRARLFVAAGEDRAKIQDYSGRGPISGWLRVAGIRLSSKQRRGETTRAAVSRNAGAVAAPPTIDPELATLQRRYGDAASAALRDAFASLTTEERSVLRLHFVDGLNLDRIGVALGLSRATVGRRMIAARERLLEVTLHRLGERIQATPAEVKSLLGLLRSQMEVSLRGLSDDPAAAPPA